MSEWMFMLPPALLVGFFLGISTQNRGHWIRLTWRVSALLSRARKRRDSDISYHLPVACDLSEMALIDAMEYARKKRISGSLRTLICGMDNGPCAGRLAQKYGLQVIVLPFVPTDAWALCWDYSAIYSNGA